MVPGGQRAQPAAPLMAAPAAQAEAAAAEPGLFERLREAAAEVTRRAHHVRIASDRLEELAAALARQRPEAGGSDPAHFRGGSEPTRLAFVLTLNAVNFGSGWFPFVKKRPGRSGYLTLAAALRDHFRAHGHWSAAALQQLSAADCAAVFGQPLTAPLDQLMQLFAQALRDLGAFLAREHRGRFAGPIERAGGSAEALVQELAHMPLYRDVARYQGFALPFYKRAQLAAADLAEAFGGRGPGRFADLDRLTLFADNLVPHVLRMFGVLQLDAGLISRCDAGELIESGSPEEVELRAVALHAVELLAGSCAQRGWPVTPRRLDNLLWWQGQSARIKARPRHRTRCTFY